MKIAILGNFDECNGIPRFKRAFAFGGDLARAIARRGHEVHVVMVCDYREIDSDQTIEQQTNLVVHLIPGRRTRIQCLTLYSQEVSAMRVLLRDIQPDVVLAHWTYEYARTAIMSRIPAVVVAHDSPWRVWRLMRQPRMLFRALYATFFVLPHIQLLITVSPHIKEEFSWCKNARVLVIPNGIMPREGGRVRKVAKTIVCVTEGNRLKNSSLMTSVFEVLKTKHPDWELRMFVKGENTVSREEIFHVLSEEADVFCSPSLEESFGMAFLEAMSCGVPCVGGEKSGAVPWVLGDAGVLCDVTRPESLVVALERVMGDYGLRLTMSSLGVQRVKDCFDIEHVADLYLDVLKQAAGV